VNDRQKLVNCLKDKSSLFKSVFDTIEGRKVLEVLEQELNPDIIYSEGDAHKTSYNLGRRDALIYINQLLRIDRNE